ncbi:YihY/virulence factor BrkB family protein [Listeria booriae]|uniref:YihY/virulence factor BrkB family protein n=1 Tax=Listeria booriae TaxID=1552123 RepID=A0A7X0WFZ7_9LIST|nr:YihY/virulence factor BrkB family protein [Listeria booriae]MBC1308871.1 YihY/virulence factor BrkB family protein [Listeria booriae]MBC1333153.1 YihY/virulence factor BrkB family protein [Listeria booriae]MBC2194932.1 YihY/virulence factor BrkB family protein [Listeria booriae]MBC2373017.1 YihY/virulence factor BrkB family protein [Listeria booriae]MBC2388553.1 YihY/virulence factor BrkB family protein [Listeria booriae]
MPLKAQTKTKLKQVGEIAKTNWKNARITSHAAQLTFYILLSILPMMLVFGNLIPLFPIPKEEIYNTLQTFMPPEVYDILHPVIESMLTNASGTAISLGLITAIWSASKCFSALQEVLNIVYQAPDRKNFIVTRIMSFLMMLVIIVVIGAVVFVFAFGEQIVTFLQDQFDLKLDALADLGAAKWFITPIFLFILFLIIYWLVPNVKWKIRKSVIGALFATIGWLAATELLSAYVSFQGDKILGFGSLSIMIVIMLWLYFVSIILLLGAFINVIIDSYKQQHL